MARRISTQEFARIRKESGLDSATLRDAIRTPMQAVFSAGAVVSSERPTTDDTLAVSAALHTARSTFYSQLQIDYWVYDSEISQLVQAPCPEWYGNHVEYTNLDGAKAVRFVKDTKGWERTCKRYLTDASNPTKFRWEKDITGREYRHIDLPLTMAYYVRAIELGNLSITIDYAASFTGDKVASALGSLHVYSAHVRAIHLAAIAYVQRRKRYDSLVSDAGATFVQVRRASESLTAASAALASAWHTLHAVDVSDELAA